MEQSKFIDLIKNKAIEGWTVGRVLPSVTIAQACLESGWGTSELATKANNLFGIKAKKDWKGDKYKVKTAEYDKNNNKFYIYADFRKYESWEKSIEDHTNFFTENSWRKENYKNFVGVTDYKKAVKELQKSGYATSQVYANSLLELIEKYQLYKYDEITKKGGKGMKIFLSVGHSILKGGGCTSASGYINEYRYNKALVPYVKKSLEKLGHSCDVIVCPEGQFTNWKQERNYKLPIANSGKYDLVCELHLNASNGAGNGSEVLYYPGDKRGLAIASRGANALSKLGFTYRGAKPRGDLYIIAQTKPTAVLFETFFCDNKRDTDLAKKIGLEKIAQTIAYAITGVNAPERKITGWQKIKNKWYYVEDNKKKAGWLEYNHNWYYLDPANFAMITGWLEYNHNWYYFNKDGKMLTGWLEYNDNKFYFNKDGKMLTGTHTMSGVEYNFDKNGYLK